MTPAEFKGLRTLQDCRVPMALGLARNAIRFRKRFIFCISTLTLHNPNKSVGDRWHMFKRANLSEALSSAGSDEKLKFIRVAEVGRTTDEDAWQAIGGEAFCLPVVAEVRLR